MLSFFRDVFRMRLPGAKSLLLTIAVSMETVSQTSSRQIKTLFPLSL
jgi:hypothetical protein